MKKIFNLSVIFAALFAALSFSSCQVEDKAGEEVEEQQLSSITVSEGQKYAFSCENKSGYIKIIETRFSDGDAQKDKVVVFELTTKKDDAKGTQFTLGDGNDYTSYFGFDGTNYKTFKQAEAVDNPEQILFALNNDAEDFVIESGNVNKKVNATGKAPETKFAIK